MPNTANLLNANKLEIKNKTLRNRSRYSTAIWPFD